MANEKNRMPMLARPQKLHLLVFLQQKCLASKCAGPLPYAGYQQSCDCFSFYFAVKLFWSVLSMRNKMKRLSSDRSDANFTKGSEYLSLREQKTMPASLHKTTPLSAKLITTRIDFGPRARCPF
jgi:hypothetical protein